MASPYLPTEQAVAQSSPEVLGIERQRKLADLLTAQGFQQPQGQMISGHYVAPSFTQQLAPMASVLAGNAVSERADVKQAELAKALRAKQVQEIATFEQMEKEKPGSGIAYALSLDNPVLRDIAKKEMEGVSVKEGEIFRKKGIGGDVTEIRGNEKLHSVDGNLVNAQGQVIFKAPKIFAPHASQLVPVQGGFAEYNPNTKTLTPIGGTQGGTSTLQPPLPQHLQTEVSSINQQKSTVNDVLKAVEQNRQYFGAKYAVPNLLGGELGSAKMNQKLPSEAVEARSQVFNTASSVIKERAGTAQSKQEKETIMRFLPSEFDSDKVVIDKLNGFNKFLESKEKGISPVVGAIPTYRPNANAPAAPAAPAAATGWGKATVESK